MYMSYLLPVVAYASVVWDGCSERDSQTLQKIQNEAARLVTGLTRSVSLENLYKECGWLRRYIFQKLLLALKFSCINKNCFFVKETDTFGHIVV